MALYTERKLSDFAGDWERLQREELERKQREQEEAYNAAQRQAQRAQSNKRAGGLAGVLQGIGESIGNVGNSLYNMFGTGAASIGDIFGSIASGKVSTKNQDDWKEHMKRLNGDENMSDKDYYLKTAGKSLDAATTLADLIPAVGAATAGTKAAKAAKIASSPLFNIAQGATSGFAQEYIDNGENATFENALKRAGVGAAASGVGQAVGNKLGKVQGNGRIARALTSNVGRGATAGAAAGAIGGGLSTALDGGDLGQTLAGVLQGAGGGAIGGGSMAGLMGIAGKGIDRLNNRIAKNGTNVVNQIPETTITKQAAEVPEAPTRRGIAVTDYDAGTQNVTVRRPNQPSSEYRLGKNAGSTIDGVLGPDNARKLPNAKQPTDADLFRKQTGGQFDNAADYLAKYPQELETLKQDYPEVYQAVRNGAQDWADINALQFDGTGATNKSNLPDLNRQQYYEDTIGKLHNKTALGETSTSAADVPDYMRNHLLNDTTGQLNGRTLNNDDILREFFRGQYGDRVDSMDLGELYDAYENLAQAANQNEVYTPENISKGIIMNGINDDVTGAFVRDLGLRQQIGVDAYPSLRKPVEVALLDNPANTETVYTKRTIAPKTTAEPNSPAKATPAQVAPIEETPLIQRGTPEYEAIQRQEYIDNRARELRNTVTDGVRNQYGTIRLNDRINGLDDAIMELAGYGLTKRSQIDGFTKRITGANGEMSKAIRKAMNEAGKTDGRLNITMEDVYRSSGAAGNKAATEKIKSRFNSIGKKYTVDADGGMNRSDMYDFGKELEREGYRNIERGGRTQNADTEVYGEAMRTLGEQYIAKATDGVDMKAYLNANKLKNVLPGNKAWAAHVDDAISKIRTVSDARSFMAAPTKLSLLADAAEYNKGTYGSNVGNFGSDADRAIRSITSGNPLRAGAQYVASKTVNSNAAKQRMIKNAMKQYQRIEAGGNAGTPISGVAGGIGDKIRNFGQTLNNDTVNNSVLGNILGKQTIRQIGLGEASNIGVNSQLQDAQAAMNNAATNYQNAANEYMANMANFQQQQQSQGANQLQTLSDAMDRALAAGDITAYGQLANLYKQAYSIYGQETATPKALTASQSKALTGLQQAEQLAQMTPDAGTAIANSPLGFLVNLGGGNEYANQAKALATTIGYLLSGATIKPDEAASIGQSYVPTAYDSEQTRQQKLARARQLLSNYMGNTDDLTQA